MPELDKGPDLKNRPELNKGSLLSKTSECDAWYKSRFSGIFESFELLKRRPHDPQVSVAVAHLFPHFAKGRPGTCSGAGATAQEATDSCLAQGIARLGTCPTASDRSIWRTLNGDDFPSGERAISPEKWVFFSNEQYGESGFPYQPLTSATPCHWTRCFEMGTGTPYWVPEELVFPLPRPGTNRVHTPERRTGLIGGFSPDEVLLRGVQDCLTRDGLIHAWYDSYPMEEWYRQQVKPLIDPALWDKIDRPNLKLRFFRIASPYSSHITLVTMEGADLEGWVFSTGSACRQTRQESWTAALLEAVKKRFEIRKLLQRARITNDFPKGAPRDWDQHSLYYLVHPQKWIEAIRTKAKPPSTDGNSDATETLDGIRKRLGPEKPILFRILTPHFVAQHFPEMLVARVLIPGLRPLHGDHQYPYLGSANRELTSAWSRIAPHPFA